MSLRNLLSEYHEEKYKEDQRDKPEEIFIKSSSWDEISKAIKKCEKQFGGERKLLLHHGENQHYQRELKNLREKLPMLISKIGDRKTTVYFKCFPEKMGSAELLIVINSAAKITIFSQLYDSFSGSASAEDYVNLNISKTMNTIRVIEIL